MGMETEMLEAQLERARKDNAALRRRLEAAQACAGGAAANPALLRVAQVRSPDVCSCRASFKNSPGRAARARLRIAQVPAHLGHACVLLWNSLKRMSGRQLLGCAATAPFLPGRCSSASSFAWLPCLVGCAG